MKDSGTISNIKSEIRRNIRLQKESTGQEALNGISLTIIDKIESLPIFSEARTIACYYPLPFEVNIIPALERWAENHRILLPVVQGEEIQLKLYRGKEHLVQGPFRVMEPDGPVFSAVEEIELIIVPGVAFDAEKNRIGYGKGFYDRLLPRLNAKKAGICFDFQLVEHIPTLSTDVKMDLILTEKQILL